MLAIPRGAQGIVLDARSSKVICHPSTSGGLLWQVDEHNVLIRMHNNPKHQTFGNNSSPIFATADAPAPQKRAKRRWSLLAQNADRVVLKEKASTTTSDKQRPGQWPVLEIRVRGQLPATVLLALDLTIDKLLRW